MLEERTMTDHNYPIDDDLVKWLKKQYGCSFVEAHMMAAAYRQAWALESIAHDIDRGIVVHICDDDHDEDGDADGQVLS